MEPGTALVVGGVLLVGAMIFGLNQWRLGAHGAYVRGDAEALRRALPKMGLNAFVSLNSALGQYAEALARVAAERPVVLDPSQRLGGMRMLVRINASEALFELGEGEKACALLEHEAKGNPFLEAGRRASLAWFRVADGRAEEALALMQGVEPGTLGPPYAAEVFFAKAWSLIHLDRFDEAAATLEHSRKHLLRASSQRNFLALEALLFERRGELDKALEKYEAAAAHLWKFQGGHALLRHGDLLEKMGRREDARTIWRRCVEQDPQCFSCGQARERLTDFPSP